MTCTFCKGYVIKASMAEGALFKCEWCGVEYKASHPDPLGYVIQFLRRELESDGMVRRITAIKRYRQFTGYGLRESKELIDTLLAALKADR